MPRTFLRQSNDLGHSCNYDDSLTLDQVLQTGSGSIEDDLNGIRSVLAHILNLQSGSWYDQVLPSFVLGEPSNPRGLQTIVHDLFELERKRALRAQKTLVDVPVTAGTNFVVLQGATLPGNTIAAVGNVTTLGTVVAPHGGIVGAAHSLAEVSGSNALAPKNLMEITDENGDEIMSDGKKVWGLLQSQDATDGHDMALSTQSAQISFVRSNSTHDDLEPVPAADIGGQTIRYCYCERIAFEDMSEQDFVAKNASIDLGAGAAILDRQASYNNQGITPVELIQNAILDLNAAGISWTIRDAVDAALLQIIEGSGGGTSQVNISADVDEFDVDAALVDFANGATINSAGTRPIAVGTTDGVLETTAGDMEVRGFGELFLDDGNQAGSTWAQTGGIKLSEDTQEWDDFETKYGEASLLSAICQAGQAAGRIEVCAEVIADTLAGNDLGGAGGGTNLSAQLPDLSGGQVEVFYNGRKLRVGAGHDVVLGSTPADGQLQMQFDVFAAMAGPPACPADVICAVRYG